MAHITTKTRGCGCAQANKAKKKPAPCPPCPTCPPPIPAPPGPPATPQPPCDQSVSPTFLAQLLALLSTPQDLPAFGTFLAANATLIDGLNPPVIGVPNILAALTPPPNVSAFTIETFSTGFTPVGANLLADVSINVTLTANGTTFLNPYIAQFTFDAQCRILAIQFFGGGLFTPAL